MMIDIKIDEENKLDLWTHRRMVDINECPHLMTEEKFLYRKALERKYGQNSSFIQSMVYGRFRRKTDDNSVFTDWDMQAVKRAMSDKVQSVHGDMKAGLELSSGGDEQILNIACGTEVVFSKAWREDNTDKLAEELIKYLLEFNVEPNMCYTDNGGAGKAIIDNMEGKGYAPVYRYMSNQDPMSRVEYADRITEDHYTFKALLQNHPIKLPKDMVLLGDMRQRRFVIDDHNRVKLERKQRHRVRTLKSPDRLDAIVMLFSEWVPPVKNIQVNEEEEYQKKYGKYHKMLEEKQSGAFAGIKEQKKIF